MYRVQMRSHPLSDRLASGLERCGSTLPYLDRNMQSVLRPSQAVAADDGYWGSRARWWGLLRKREGLPS